MLDEDAKQIWEADRHITTYRTFNKLFIRPDPPIMFVSAVNPYKQHERLAIQQGVFLCPGDLTKPFEENLSEITGPNAANDFIKLEIDANPKARRDIFARLRRMNVGSTTLFPGLDGFARSLTILDRPEYLVPDNDWPG